MKKFLLCLSLCCALLLTGCGGKTLKCTMTEEEDGLKMTGEVTANFKNDKISSVKIISAVEVPDDMKEYVDSFKSMLESEFKGDEYKDADVKVETKGNRITATIKMDASKLSSEQLKEISLQETLEEAKKELEEQGFTCK